MNDLISRQYLLDKFEPWLKVKDYNDGELNMLKAILYEIRFMPPATDKNVGTKLGTNSAEVGTDCISRQAAIDAIDEYMVGKNCAADGTMMARLINELVIKRLPPAEPKRGEWIEDKYGITICSECRKPRRDNRIDHIRWCNGCGAKMEGVSNES